MPDDGVVSFNWPEWYKVRAVVLAGTVRVYRWNERTEEAPQQPLLTVNSTLGVLPAPSYIGFECSDAAVYWIDDVKVTSVAN